MMSLHTKPNDGATCDWLTPPEVIASVGGWEAFDLDPCCPASMPWRTAKSMLFVDQYDGLAEPWQGRVWLNPPYGRGIGRWLGKMVGHGNGIALVFARTEVESWFFPYVWEAADALLFLRGRLYFRRPDGSKVHNAGHGSVLAAYGRKNAEALRNCPLPGKFVRNK